MTAHSAHPDRITNVAELVAAADRGQTLDFLFFWSHQAPPGGRVGSSCLSQWWPQPFTDDGHVFATAEHYMMAHKAWLFGDHHAVEKILAAPHPRHAKALGRTVRGFEAQQWERERVGIVQRGNLAKFAQHPLLRDFLLSTGDKILVETSPYDRIWGIGLPATDPRAATPGTWRGLNLLGFALMAVRDHLTG